MYKSHILFSPIYILWYNLVGGHALWGERSKHTEWIIFEIIYRFFWQNGSFRPLASPWSRSHRWWSQSEEEESSGRWRGTTVIPHWLCHNVACREIFLDSFTWHFVKGFILLNSVCLPDVFYFLFSVFHISPDIESCTLKEYLIIYLHLTTHISECFAGFLSHFSLHIISITIKWMSKGVDNLSYLS